MQENADDLVEIGNECTICQRQTPVTRREHEQLSSLFNAFTLIFLSLLRCYACLLLISSTRTTNTQNGQSQPLPQLR